MYKKIIITIIIVFVSVAYIYSQNHIEALRYSQQFYSATAKSDAMGNSLSAVGADMSAMTINPAGIAVYKSSQFTFTPNFIMSFTEGTLSQNVESDNKFGLNITNAGYVGVLQTSGIVRNINFGMAYNSTNDFRQRTVVFAENQDGSVLDYLVYNANIDRYSPFREDLAWRGWLINFDDVANEYWSFVTDDASYGITQRNEVYTRGGMGEIDFSLGANIADKLYIGGSIALTSINYKEESSFSETDFPIILAEDSDNPGNFIEVNPVEINYKQTLYTEGTGFNSKVGFIFQPLKFLRLAGAVHSPSFYSISDDYTASMYIEYPTPDESGYTNYEPDSANIFEYRLQTPFRANAGIAIILDSYEIGKFFTIPMTISVDYEYVDYRQAYLRSYYESDYSFNVENNDIYNLYKETHNIRAGAEVNLGALKIRGGYAVYSSPFAIDANFLDNAKVVYSGGIGFASEHAFLDMSYSYSPTTSTMYLYNANNVYPHDPMGDLTEPTASLNNTKQFIKLTMGLRF